MTTINEIRLEVRNNNSKVKREDWVNQYVGRSDDENVKGLHVYYTNELGDVINKHFWNDRMNDIVGSNWLIIE